MWRNQQYFMTYLLRYSTDLGLLVKYVIKNIYRLQMDSSRTLYISVKSIVITR